MRRVLGLVGVAAGLFLVIIPLALDLFDTSAAADRALDDVEPFFTDAGLQQVRGFADDIGRAAAELDGGGAGSLIAAAAPTPAAFQAAYPDAATLLQNVTASHEAAEKTVANLERQQDEYELAKEIPGLGLPVRSGPWITVGIGLVVVVASILVLRSPGAIPQLVVAVVGALLVALPLAFDYPAKLDATEEILASITPTPAAVEATRQQVEGGEAGLTELAEDVLPAAARNTGATAAEVDAVLAEELPAFASVLQRREEILEPFRNGLALRTNRLDDLILLQAAPIDAVLWIHLVPGAVLAVAATVAIVTARSATGRVDGPTPT